MGVVFFVSKMVLNLSVKDTFIGLKPLHIASGMLSSSSSFFCNEAESKYFRFFRKAVRIIMEMNEWVWLYSSKTFHGI